MLTEKQITKIELGYYWDGWRLDLCSDWWEHEKQLGQAIAAYELAEKKRRKLEAQVAALQSKSAKRLRQIK